MYVPLRPEDRIGRLLEGKLQLTDILGTGAYGVVYSAVDIDTHVRYAVKCLSKFNQDGTPLEHRQVAYQQREIRLHYLASAHPNVVSMFKISEDADCIYVILEYCPEGDLFLNITERGQYVGKDDLSKKIFLQILDAVAHCHKMGIYHRDLKPENILVTNHGDTVKLADFGLATSDDRSEDYGCGSTFYMSPECLHPSSRKPFYMCAPNDIWSLGVILVNLTCGRNPWKQASFQDSTYRAFARNPAFLKSILPVTDELNDILARIFNPSPEYRITISELRDRIMACSRLTVIPGSVVPTPPTSPEYASFPEEAIDDSDYDTSLSPSSTNSDGSLTSETTVDDDFEDEMCQEQEPVGVVQPNPMTFEPENPIFYNAQEFIPQQQQHYNGPMAIPAAPVVVPSQHPGRCAPQSQQVHCPQKPSYSLWDFARCVQQAPNLMIQNHAPFRQQVSFMPSFQGCY